MQNPELFTKAVQLDVADLDPAGSVRLPVLLDQMQRVADGHAEAFGVGREGTVAHGVVWILARVRVELNAPLQMGEVRISTWPGKVARAICPRYFAFDTPQGQRLGVASTAWALMDLRTHRLTTAQACGLPFDPQGTVEPPLPLPGRIEGAQTRTGVLREAVYSDLDVNGHVNNARYANWVCDLLGPACFETHYAQMLQINYHHEILPGAQVRLCKEQREGTVCISGTGATGDTLHFEAQVRLKAR